MESDPEPLLQHNQTAPTDNDDTELLFVGKNYEYYRAKWEKLKSSEFSWNWAAFLFNISWLAYRKIKTIAWALLALNIIVDWSASYLGLTDKNYFISMMIYGLVIALMCGLMGSGWYRNSTQRKIQEIRETVSPENRKAELIKRGGTSIGFVILIALIGGMSSVLSSAVFSPENPFGITSSTQDQPQAQVEPKKDRETEILENENKRAQLNSLLQQNTGKNLALLAQDSQSYLVSAVAIECLNKSATQANNNDTSKIYDYCSGFLSEACRSDENCMAMWNKVADAIRERNNLQSQINDISANVGYRMRIKNSCQNQSVSVALTYQDLDGNWHSDGWWDIAANTTSDDLSDASSHILRSKNSTVDFYAESSPKGLVWSGNYPEVYGGQTYKASRIEVTPDDDYRYVIELTCPTPDTQPESAPSSEGVFK